MLSKKNKEYKSLSERGNIIDQLGALLVMGFMFALIFVFAAYGNMVQKRLEINNIAKEYLYKMEQYGYMSSDDINNMTTDLSTIDVVANNFDGTTTSQVAYGDLVELKCNVSFRSPMHKMIKPGAFDFLKRGIGIPGEQVITYEVEMSATSKW